MSLQDDYYDVADTLKGSPDKEAFERIWFAFCDIETEIMARDGKFGMNRESYRSWREQRLKDLNNGKDDA